MLQSTAQSECQPLDGSKSWIFEWVNIMLTLAGHCNTIVSSRCYTLWQFGKRCQLILISFLIPLLRFQLCMLCNLIMHSKWINSRILKRHAKCKKRKLFDYWYTHKPLVLELGTLRAPSHQTDSQKHVASKTIDSRWFGAPFRHAF